jgi:hypothetical protein
MPPRRRLLPELSRQPTAGAEEKRLDGGPADAEVVGDLAVRATLPLPKEQSAPLHLRQPQERLLDAE